MISRLAIPFSMWQRAVHGDSSDAGFVHRPERCHGASDARQPFVRFLPSAVFAQEAYGFLCLAPSARNRLSIAAYTCSRARGNGLNFLLLNMREAR